MAIYNIDYINESLINNFIENAYNDIFNNPILMEAFNPSDIANKAVQFIKKIFDKIKEIALAIKKKISDAIKNSKQRLLKSKSKNAKESLKTKQFSIKLTQFECSNLRKYVIEDFFGTKIPTTEEGSSKFNDQVSQKMNFFLNTIENDKIKDSCFCKVNVSGTLDEIIDQEGEILLSSEREIDNLLKEHKIITDNVIKNVRNISANSDNARASIYVLEPLKIIMNGLINISNKVDRINDENIAIVNKLIEDANPLNDM